MINNSSQDILKTATTVQLPFYETTAGQNKGLPSSRYLPLGIAIVALLLAALLLSLSLLRK